jgi:hypothetical protein
MNQHFSCRNGHRWGLAVEGAPINDRWIFCPVCGAAPKLAIPMTRWRRFARWAQRNPAAIGLAASIVIMLATFGVIAATQWREAEAQRAQARQEAEQALREAERLQRQGGSDGERWRKAREAVEAAARGIGD